MVVTAIRGEADISEKALEILADSQREFASSEFIKLEVIPKAIYNQQTTEAQFYEVFFSAVRYWARDLEQIRQNAYQIACQYSLAAMDALHIAAALSVGAEEFITIEKRTKPMYRVTSIKVISIFDDPNPFNSYCLTAN